jgi:hypothetical protein
MPDKVSVDLEKGQKGAFEKMEERGDADNQSEAMRRCINIGLAELGYLHGDPRDVDGETPLRTVARRFADAFALVGLILVGFTFVYPLGLRAIAAFPFAASLGCYGIDRVLATYEPAVTRRLAAIFGSEKA